ncbi:hypothetical protein T4E_9733, partial [Trichinella pseudospiralis]
LARKEIVQGRGKYSAERDKIVGHLLDRTRDRSCEVMGKKATANQNAFTVVVMKRHLFSQNVCIDAAGMCVVLPVKLHKIFVKNGILS